MADQDKPTKPLRRGIYLLPSLLTSGNLFAGFYSIVSTLDGDFRGAAIALGIAFVLDGLDGRIARLTNAQSEFGKAYDSLADLLAFGAAPAILALSWGLWDLGRVGWLASFLYLVCAAMRLARFNIKASSDHRFFIGFPSPAASGLIGALAFYWPARLESALAARLVLAVVFAAALLMISRFRYRSFKDLDLRRPQPTIVLVLVATVIGIVALDPENVLLLLAVGYTVSGPLERAWTRLSSRRDTEREIPPEEPGTEGQRS